MRRTPGPRCEHPQCVCVREHTALSGAAVCAPLRPPRVAGGFPPHLSPALERVSHFDFCQSDKVKNSPSLFCSSLVTFEVEHIFTEFSSLAALTCDCLFKFALFKWVSIVLSCVALVNVTPAEQCTEQMPYLSLAGSLTCFQFYFYLISKAARKLALHQSIGFP